MRFLGNVLAVIVGLIIFSVLSILVSFGIIGMIAASGSEEVSVAENSILHLNLNGRTLVERTNEDDLSLPIFGSAFGQPNTAGLVNLKMAIEEAKNNESIQGIYLNTGLIIAGQANLLELREALEDFKTSGKFILAYDEAYSEGGYYLASIADEIYLNPMGGIEFNGFSSNILFFTGLFEKVGVKPEVFRVGEFKSAVEPFILTQMSEANRLQTQAFLSDMNQHALNDIAESRGINIDTLAQTNNQMLVREPEDAVKYKLIDATKYRDEVIDILAEKVKMAEGKELEFKIDDPTEGLYEIENSIHILL